MAADVRSRILSQGHRLSVWTDASNRDQSLSVPETGLCNVCLCFLKETEGRRHLWRPHHRTPEDLAEAVRHRCVMCSELWHRFDSEWHLLNQPAHEQWSAWKEANHHQLFVIGWWCYEAEDMWCMCLSVENPRHCHVQRTFISAKRLTSLETTSQAEQALQFSDLDRLSSTGGADAMTRALNWMQECQFHHSCGPRATSSWLPSRLVDVSPEQGKQFFRIISPIDENITAPYMTLSHCWGGNKGVLQLTKGNQTQLYAGINKNDLPPTFLDAMNVCSRLQLRYLWIDSLCIVQDDAHDWAKETQSMCDIYKNALCNIAATANTNFTMPLFRQRQARVVNPLRVTIPDEIFSRTIIAGGVYGLIDSQLWRSNVDLQPLNSRAWVFQERLLSPRTIHFTQNQVIWECSEMAAAETYPHDKIPLLQNNLKKQSFRADHAGVAESCDASSEECSFCVEWFRLVFGFSSGRLTFPDDRPKAIFGLGREMESLHQANYVLGLFRGHLRRQLLWWSPDRPGTFSSTGSKPSTRLTPTFSWLSLDSRISTFHWYPTTWLYEIVDLSLEENDIEQAHNQTLRSTIEIKCSPIRIFLEGFSKEKDSDRILCTVKGGDALHDTYTWPDASREDLPDSSDGRDHCVVPMKVQESESYSLIEALILETISGAPKTFRRIGYLHSKDSALLPLEYLERRNSDWVATSPALETIILV